MQPSLLLSIVSLLQLSPFTFAHSLDDDFPVPRVFGGLAANRHRPRHLIEEVQDYTGPQLQPRGWPSKPSQKCGPGLPHCKPGDCCSPIGFCGRGAAYCESPNCQIEYSNGCDAFTVPLGASTLNVSRPLIGNVTYDGAGISQCQKAGQLAITFDDGPYNYTSHLLDVLAAHGVKATFFITGNNLSKGQIDINSTGWPALIRRMHAEGHQIAGHSWGHQNLSSLNETTLTNQVVYLEMAFRNILGFIPTYFRPPYDDCQDLCPGILKKLGYHIVYENVVDNDWTNDAESKIEYAKGNFTKMMNETNPRDVNYIFLEHDTHYQTSWNLTDYMLDYLQLTNYSKSVTVGECMGDPPENWYRPAGGAPNMTLLMYESHASTLRSTLRYSTLLLVFGQLIATLYI